MKKRTVWVATLMSLAVSGMAQQVLPKDAAGDKEYARVCREYELKAENSIELLEAYLDKASLANLSPVYVIHGHGTGALKTAVRDFLIVSPYVAKFRPGEDTEGGDGVSVIDIK